MNLDLGGKRALVTGASRGIGLAIAKVLAGEGAHVAILARDKARLEDAVAALPGRAIAVQADTGDDELVHTAVASVAEQFGGIDILVNNAAEPGGTRQGVRPSQVSGQQVGDDVNIKVVGYLRTARAVAPLLTAQGWGRIVNISGLAARQTGNLVATLQNAGVVALTKNLANELAPAGVNVTAVHPGLTVTERTPALLDARAREWGVTPDEAGPAGHRVHRDRPQRHRRGGRLGSGVPGIAAGGGDQRRRHRRRRRHPRAHQLLSSVEDS